MAIQYVGGQSGSRANPSADLAVSFSLSGGLAATPAAGDLVVVSSVVGTAAGNPSQAIVTPTGYTALGQLNQSAQTNDTSQNVSWKFMTATPDTSVTIPGTGNNAYGQAYTIQVFRGVNPNTPMDVTPVSAGATGTGQPNPGSITPVTKGSWIVICGGGAAATGAAYTAPTNYTTNFLAPAAGADTTDGMAGSGYRADWVSGAEDPGTFGGGTTNAADSWTAYTLALRPAVEWVPPVEAPPVRKASVLASIAMALAFVPVIEAAPTVPELVPPVYVDSTTRPVSKAVYSRNFSWGFSSANEVVAITGAGGVEDFIYPVKQIQYQTITGPVSVPVAETPVINWTPQYPDKIPVTHRPLDNQLVEPVVPVEASTPPSVVYPDTIAFRLIKRGSTTVIPFAVESAPVSVETGTVGDGGLVTERRLLQYQAVAGPVVVPAPAETPNWFPIYPDSINQRSVNDSSVLAAPVLTIPDPVPDLSWKSVYSDKVYPKAGLSVPNQTALAWNTDTPVPPPNVETGNGDGGAVILTRRLLQYQSVAGPVSVPSVVPPTVPELVTPVYPASIPRKPNRAVYVWGQQHFGVEISVPVESWEASYPRQAPPSRRVRKTEAIIVAPISPPAPVVVPEITPPIYPASVIRKSNKALYGPQHVLVVPPSVIATPTRARVALAELEAPFVATRGRISVVELEAPFTPTRGRISFVEVEAPFTPTRGEVSFTELEAPFVATRGRISWVELAWEEIPIAGSSSRIGFSMLQGYYIDESET